MLGETCTSSKRAALAELGPDNPVAVEPRGSCLRCAVILGAGPGTTWCPLSVIRPRHLWPVGAEPLITTTLQTLQAWGIEEVVLTCPRSSHDPAMAPAVEEAARRCQLPIEHLTEPRPAGSAGALRPLLPLAEGEHLLVVTGTPLDTEFDRWHPLLSTYWRSHADAVVAVTEKTSCDEADHRDVRYQPGMRPAGLWILGPRALQAIPAMGHYSIDHQLLPKLEESGGAVTAIAVPGHAEKARSEGFEGVRERLLQRIEHAVDPRAFVHPEAIVSGPVALGPGCRVDAGAVIEGPVAIGANTVVKSGARVAKSIIWERVVVDPGSEVIASVVTGGVTVPVGERVEDGIVVSKADYRRHRTILEARAENGRRVADHAKLIVSRESSRSRSRNSGQTNLRPPREGGGHALCDKIKRAADIAIALPLLIVALPLILLAAIAVKLDSRGPAFFRQTRSGRNGEPFTMLKLRTMVADAHALQAKLREANEADGPMFKIDRDPRVTRVGAILRKACIDELPQLINVLRGDMSLVGPRPLADHEMSIVGGWRDIRLSVRPGITGLWQVDGRSNLSFGDWIYHDIRYVTHRSLMLDARVLIKTVIIVLGCMTRAGELGRRDEPAQDPLASTCS